MKIAIEIGDRGGEGSAYGNLGVAYSSLDDCQKSIEYHEKHLKIAIEIGDRGGEGRAYVLLTAIASFPSLACLFWYFLYLSKAIPQASRC